MITIAVCVAIMIILWLFNRKNPEAKMSISVNPTPASENQSKPSGKMGAVDISVYPQNREFDRTVFDLSKFQNLKEYEPLAVDEKELGRDNPFSGN